MQGGFEKIKSPTDDVRRLISVGRHPNYFVEMGSPDERHDFAQIIMRQIQYSSRRTAKSNKYKNPTKIYESFFILFNSCDQPVFAVRHQVMFFNATMQEREVRVRGYKGKPC